MFRNAFYIVIKNINIFSKAKNFFFNLVLQQMNNHSHQRCFIEIGVLKHFAISTGKHLCQNIFLIKLQTSGLQLYSKSDPSTGAFL